MSNQQVTTNYIEFTGTEEEPTVQKGDSIEIAPGAPKDLIKKYGAKSVLKLEEGTKTAAKIAKGAKGARENSSERDDVG